MKENAKDGEFKQACEPIRDDMAEMEEQDSRASKQWSQEDENDLSPPEAHSALLLFLHALASKPSLVHLDLISCDITPFVLDHMPVWPHLLSLDLHDNASLDDYHPDKAFNNISIAHLNISAQLFRHRHCAYHAAASAGGATLSSVPNSRKRGQMWRADDGHWLSHAK